MEEGPTVFRVFAWEWAVKGLGLRVQRLKPLIVDVGCARGWLMLSRNGLVVLQCLGILRCSVERLR